MIIEVNLIIQDIYLLGMKINDSKNLPTGKYVYKPQRKHTKTKNRRKKRTIQTLTLKINKFFQYHSPVV